MAPDDGMGDAVGRMGVAGSGVKGQPRLGGCVARLDSRVPVRLARAKDEAVAPPADDGRGPAHGQGIARARA